MTATLLGYTPMKGTSKKTGKPYDGYMFHLGYIDERVTGTATAQLFIDSDILIDSDCPVKVGNTYEFVYEVNFSGYQRLKSIEVCWPKKEQLIYLTE